MDKLPRLFHTSFERTRVAGQTSLERFHLAYCDAAIDHQHAYDSVCEYRALTVSREERRNSTPRPILNSPLVAGCGCILRLPPPIRALKRTRTPTSSGSSSCSTCRARINSWQLAPAAPLTPRTTLRLALSPNSLGLTFGMPT